MIKRILTPDEARIKELEAENRRLRESLQMVRKMIRNSRKAPNLIDAIDRETFAALNPNPEPPQA